MIDLEELKRLEGEATVAPWDVHEYTDGARVDSVDDVCVPVCEVLHTPERGEIGANARLIPALRNAAPALLATVEAADRMRDAAKVALLDMLKAEYVSGVKMWACECCGCSAAEFAMVEHADFCDIGTLVTALAAYRAARGEEGE